MLRLEKNKYKIPALSNRRDVSLKLTAAEQASSAMHLENGNCQLTGPAEQFDGGSFPRSNNS